MHRTLILLQPHPWARAMPLSFAEMDYFGWLSLYE
jgi:hypothetical protein